MLTKNLGDVFELSRNEQSFKLEMTNIAWKIFHVTPSDFAKIYMYDIIKSGVSLIFRMQLLCFLLSPILLLSCSQHSAL